MIPSILLTTTTKSDPYYSSSSSLKLPILLETDHFAVVAKPPCVPCHRTEIQTVNGRTRRQRQQRRRRRKGDEEENSNHDDDDNEDDDFIVPVIQRAKLTFPQHANTNNIHLVHRLDSPTSGCLLLAFSSDACRKLSQALSTHGIKTYYSLCRGDSGSLMRERCRRLGLGADEMTIGGGTTTGPFLINDNVKDSKGIQRTAVTEIQSLWGSTHPRRTCFIQSRLTKTGRWHQIRQHLGKLNHPIVGEKQHHKDIYENKEWKILLESLGLEQRLFLHCQRLHIPMNDELNDLLLLNNNTINDNDDDMSSSSFLDVQCPLPSDMQTVIDLMDWSKDVRKALPELFELYPTIA